MADTTPSVPAEAPVTPESITDTSTNSNPAPQPAPDMHGFTSEELAKMRTFFDNSGGFEAVKSKISNPQPAPQAPVQPDPQTAPAQPVSQPQAQQVGSQTQPYPEGQFTGEGFTSVQELATERYFKDLARSEKYANIADQIENGSVIKEMVSMGMTPIDANYGINVDQVTRFLNLKAASVPTKPSSATPEASNAPTVDWINVGENITSREQAFNVLRQSYEARSRGLTDHPATAKAEEYLKNHPWSK